MIEEIALAAKLNQAAPAHPNLWSNIPAQSFKAEPALPDAHPPVSEAGHFDAFGGKQTGDAFGTGFPLKHQS